MRPYAQALRAALAAILLLTIAPARAQEAVGSARPSVPGIEVKVTAEMTGAGIVSSGVTLPPIPPVSGTRRNPVPSWGKHLPYPVVLSDRRTTRFI